MLKIKFFILTILFAVSISTIVYGQNDIDIVEKLELSKSDSLIIKLNTQIEMMSDYNDKILSTVYWSLSFIGLIGAILISYGLYMNYRLSDKDIKRIKDETNSLIQNELSRIEKNLSDVQNNYYTETLKIANSSGESSVKTLKHSFDRQMNYMKIDLVKLKAEILEDKKSPYGAIIEYIEMADLGVQLDSNFHIDDSLDKIIQIIEVEKKVPTYILTDLEALFKILPENFLVLKKKIDSLLEKSQ